MKKIVLLLFICCGIKCPTHACLDSIAIKYDEVLVDNNSNIYACNIKGIYKYDKNLIFKYSYEYNKYGAPTSIDVHIPMKVLLFFAQYNKVIVLDNRMAVVREIDLTKVSSDFNNVICFSADNNLWVFDNTLQSLTKYNQNFSVLYKYENMNIRMMKFIQANKITEVSNYLVLSDTTAGFYIFDILGNFVNHFMLSSSLKYQIIENQLYFIEDNHLKSMDVLTNTLKVFDLKFNEQVKDFKLSAENLVLLYDNKIELKELNP